MAALVSLLFIIYLLFIVLQQHLIPYIWVHLKKNPMPVGTIYPFSITNDNN
jgi:hypothetical protein